MIDEGDNYVYTTVRRPLLPKFSPPWRVYQRMKEVSLG